MSISYEEEGDRQGLLQALGESATYTPSGGVAKSIYVIFDNDVVRETDTQGSHPEAECSTADLTGTPVDGELVVSGNTYKITNTLPDNQGMTTLLLSKVS